jgi:hypothetical protein
LRLATRAGRSLTLATLEEVGAISFTVVEIELSSATTSVARLWLSARGGGSLALAALEKIGAVRLSVI